MVMINFVVSHFHYTSPQWDRMEYESFVNSLKPSGRVSWLLGWFVEFIGLAHSAGEKRLKVRVDVTE